MFRKSNQKKSSCESRYQGRELLDSASRGSAPPNGATNINGHDPHRWVGGSYSGPSTPGLRIKEEAWWNRRDTVLDGNAVSQLHYHSDGDFSRHVCAVGGSPPSALNRLYGHVSATPWDEAEKEWQGERLLVHLPLRLVPAAVRKLQQSRGTGPERAMFVLPGSDSINPTAVRACIQALKSAGAHLSVRILPGLAAMLARSGGSLSPSQRRAPGLHLGESVLPGLPVGC